MEKLNIWWWQRTGGVRIYWFHLLWLHWRDRLICFSLSPNFIHKQPQTLRLLHIIIASPVIYTSLYTNVFLWSKRSQNLELFNNILQQRSTLLLGKLPIWNRFMELYCHHVEPRGSDWQQERVLMWIFLLFSPRYRCTLVFWLSKNNNNNQPIISTIE